MSKRLSAGLSGALLLVSGPVGCSDTGAVAQAISQEANIVGTVEVPLGTRLTSDLLDLATVTEADAVAAAQQALGVADAPAEVELEVENGYLVWEVEFPGQEVVVDAGGEVLLIENEEEGADDDAGEDEGPGEDDD